MARVLLVDDEDALRMMMGRQIRKAGHDVTLAEDGIVAVEFLEKEIFDVVVSDMKMPRMDGMGLLERARCIAPDTEFIILTGHGNLENAIEAFKTGNVFDYLLKPLEDIHELDGVVARAVERRFLRHENLRLVSELQARIEELESARKELAKQAECDSLTGLLNHRSIHEKLNRVLETDDGTPCSVMMLDIDDFKLINDTYSHPVGDQAIRCIAQALVDTCPSNAYVGRCGGDEFMVVLAGMDSSQAEHLAEQIRAHIKAHPIANPEGVLLPLRLCYGIADTVVLGRSIASLITGADAALYEGKNEGGNTIKLHRVAKSDVESANRTRYDILDSLVTAIDRKDNYTREHSAHMTSYALDLAQELNCSEDVFRIVRVAGLLHDVGKIGVPDRILLKPGKLTEDERQIMQGHVTLSALIIHGLPHLMDILEAVSCHHERWDGTGYPKGLAGDQIPYLGRIMSIADAFSAMTLDRPYRTAMAPESAMAEIARGAGTQFDPKLTDVFLEMLEKKAKKAESRPKAA